MSALLFAACGDDSEEQDEACTPGVPDACDNGMVCEEVPDGEPICAAPVVVRGHVLDVNSGGGVEGARIVALDVNGSARSSVALSGDDGAYELMVPVDRDAEGAPLASDAITLTVAAPGYQSFPSPPREALPIDLSPTAEKDDGEVTTAWVVMNAATDVGLVGLMGDITSLSIVSGSVDHELAPGTLIVAVQGDKAVSTAVADIEGAFTLFNVPAGETQIEGYRAGLHVTPVSVTTEAGELLENVALMADVEQLSRVTGSVSLVNADGGASTSVILVLESTFVQNAAIARGISPAGLRVGDVSGAFEILDVPPGKYAVLAAFENDGLVRDPDEGISGTDVVHIDVKGTGDTALSQGFKVTGALAVRTPGAEGLELIETTQAPTFEWEDDSSEDGYELRVFDALGNLVHEALDVARVSGGEDVSYTWQNADLTAGSIYQFRVLSFREPQKGGGRTYISATEDLRGVFQAGMPE